MSHLAHQFSLFCRQCQREHFLHAASLSQLVAHLRETVLGFSGPSQPEVERDLAQYERYVANRESILQEEPVLQGVQA